MKNKGFTLIELIIYVALISIFITGAVTFALNVIAGRQKSTNQTIITSEAQTLLSRINYEISIAQKLNSLSSTQIILEDAGGNLTIIELSGSTINFTQNTTTLPLSSNQIEVTNLSFTNLSSANTANIQTNIALQKNDQQISLTTSAQLNAQYNQARQILIDLTSLTFSPSGRIVSDITLQNYGTDTLILDQITIFWNPDTGQNLTQVQLDSGTPEYTSSASSGSIVEIVDFIINSGSSTDLQLSFDSNMQNSTIYLELIFSDASVHKAEFTLGSASPISPTPTSTTTPNTCASYCVSLGYNDGICRQNANQCTSNGQTHQAGGNSYCTGGPSADTCCCTP